RRWLWAALLGSGLMAVAVLLLIGRSRVESSSGTGFVEVAFTGSLSTSDSNPISAEYQRILLNVVSVRLNPSADLTLSDSDSSWVEIPVPAAIGSTNPTQFITTSLNFGGTGTLLTAATSVLQLDLVPLQNLPFFFNAASVTAQSYGQVELVLNSPN